MANYGGNIIRNWDKDTSERQEFASGPYEYFMQVVENSFFDLPNYIKSYTVFFLEVAEGTTIVSEDGKIKPVQGDVIQVENKNLNMKVSGGKVKLLVSGVSKIIQAKPSVHLTHYNEIYKVNKPWGHELWLNGEHPAYCLKQVALRGGMKTSLQYHQMKKETNVLFEGDAYIHYKSNPEISNEKVHNKDIDRIKISPVSSVDVVPNVIHRVESISDILLYETSTPHLNDVIRIADDSKRASGRIETEHQSQ